MQADTYIPEKNHSKNWRRLLLLYERGRDDAFLFAFRENVKG